MSEGDAFRNFVGICMTNVSTRYFEGANKGELLDPVDVLFHNSCNGNPVIFGLDRLVPPTPESQDHIAREMMAVSERRGHEPTPTWHPELQETPARDLGMAFA